MNRRLSVALAVLALAACVRGRGPSDSITLSVPYEVDTLDPHAFDRLGNAVIGRHFYDSLVGTDSEMGVHPRLAERWDTPDLLTWIFHLRPGVTFHDGRSLTSADVVYTFDRLQGSKDLEMGLYGVQITSVKALDALTVEIRTRRPMGVLLNKLCRIAIIPAGAGPELRDREIGTGPYRLAEWSSGVRIGMTVNETYWGPRPPLRKAVFLLGRTPEQAVEEIRTGVSQFANCNSRDVARALDPVKDLHVVRRAGAHVKYLGFDLARSDSAFVSVKPNPFLKRSVREAVSLAIDRKSLSARIPTFGLPASQFVPPAIFGFNPELPELAHDQARARTLLAESGLPGGFEVTLHTRRLLEDTGRLVKEQLAAVGIRVTLKALPDPEFFSLAGRHEPSLILSRFGCASGDISDVLDAAFHSVDESRRFGTNNYGAYSSPALDQAIEQSAEVLEASDRRRNLYELVRQITSDNLWIPLYYDENLFALKRNYRWQPRADSYVLVEEISIAR